MVNVTRCLKRVHKNPSATFSSTLSMWESHLWGTFDHPSCVFPSSQTCFQSRWNYAVVAERLPAVVAGTITPSVFLVGHPSTSSPDQQYNYCVQACVSDVDIWPAERVTGQRSLCNRPQMSLWSFAVSDSLVWNGAVRWCAQTDPHHAHTRPTDSGCFTQVKTLNSS